MIWSYIIRENITPRGDGNYAGMKGWLPKKKIRENITPRGDGNIILAILSEIWYNTFIRENITPRGDGNISSKNGVTYINLS